MECPIEQTPNDQLKEWRCYWNHCNGVFFDITHYILHVERHIEGNPIDLWICKWLNCPHKNRFKHRYMLQRHLRTHTRELPFSCEHCSSSFSTRENLNRHDCGHTGRLPYPCRKCNKRYARTSERLKCEAFHAGKKYPCSLCDKVYTDSGSLRRHRRRDHGVSEISKHTTNDWIKPQRDSSIENTPQLEDHSYKTEQAVFPSAAEVMPNVSEDNDTDMKLTVEEVMQTVEPWILLPTPQDVATSSVHCSDQPCRNEMENDVDSVCENLNYGPATSTVNVRENEEVAYIHYAIPTEANESSRNYIDSPHDSEICSYPNVSIVVQDSSIINIELPNSQNFDNVTQFPYETNVNANMPVNLSMVCHNKYERGGKMLNNDYALPPIHTLTITSLSKYFNEQPMQDVNENTGPLVVSIDGALDLTSGHGMPATFGESEGGVRCGCGAIDLSISTEWTPEPGFSFTSLLNSNLPYDPIDLSSAAVPLSSVDDYK